MERKQYTVMTPYFRFLRAEEFREQAMAEQAKLAADSVGDYYQGGTFCAQEFAGDRGKVWK